MIDEYKVWMKNSGSMFKVNLVNIMNFMADCNVIIMKSVIRIPRKESFSVVSCDVDINNVFIDSISFEIIQSADIILYEHDIVEYSFINPFTGKEDTIQGVIQIHNNGFPLLSSPQYGKELSLVSGDEYQLKLLGNVYDDKTYSNITDMKLLELIKDYANEEKRG